MPSRLRPLLLLTVAGCAATAEEESVARLEQALAQSRASLAAVGATVPREGDGAAPASRPATGRPPAAQQAAVVPPTPPAPRVAPRQAGLRDDPFALAASPGGQGPPPTQAAELLGLSAERVAIWLGPPALRRAEGPGAEIWLYAGTECRLDLILYREAGPLVVAHAAARALGAARQSEAACLGDIAAPADRRPRSAGGGAGGGAA